MAMPSNIQQWNPLRADFSDGNQAFAIAQRGISDAGNIFGRLRDSILKAEQDSVDNAFREKKFTEDVRQFGIRAEDVDLDRTERGRIADQSNATNLEQIAVSERNNKRSVGAQYARLGFEKETKAEERARLQEERNAYNLAMQDAIGGSTSAREQMAINDARIQALDNQTKTLTADLSGTMTGTLADLDNPQVREFLKQKETLMAERNTLAAANEKLRPDTLPATNRQTINDRFNRGLTTSGYGYLAASNVVKEGTSETDFARERDRAAKTAEAAAAKELADREYKFKTEQAKILANDKKEAQKTLDNILSKTESNGITGRYYTQLSKALDEMQSQGFDTRDIASVLSQYNYAEDRTFWDTTFQEAIDDVVDDFENSAIVKRLLKQAENNDRLPKRKPKNGK